MLEVVGDEVEAAEKKEDGQGKAGQNLGPFETKGVPDTAPSPHFKVPKHLNRGADRGAAGIEEDQVGQGHGRKRAFRLEKDEDGDGEVAQAPVEPRPLVPLSALPCFCNRRYRQRRGEDRRWSRRRFLEDLVLRRDATMLVSVATALPNVL